MDYNLIKDKYGWCSSWAIWKKRDTNKKEKYGMDDISFFDNINTNLLNPNIILVGLNISKKLTDEPFSNFHPKHNTAHDYKTRYALEETLYWGSYMTDIIKDYEDVVSNNVMKYLRDNPEFEKENIDKFKQEIIDIGSVNPILIAFGNSSYKILNKYFKDTYKIFKVSHYSSNITKEQLKTEFLNFNL